MIKKVSNDGGLNSSHKLNSPKDSNNANFKSKTGDKIKPYADSFVSYTKKSAPAFLALTLVWTSFDKAKYDISLAKSLTKNIFGFFLPVLIGSSALSAVISNKKIRQNDKNSVSSKNFDV